MDAIEVYVSESNQIVIKQDSASRQETSLVIIHPEQVDTVVNWLREAQAEIQEDRRLAR